MSNQRDFGMVRAQWNGLAPQRHHAGRGQPYWYALGTVARPEFWNIATRAPRGQYGAVRADEVQFPSRKGLFINWHHAFAGSQSYFGRDSQASIQGVRVETAFCDGSAREIDSGRLREPVRDGEGPFSWPYARMHAGVAVVHTVDGVRGRDVE